MRGGGVFQHSAARRRLAAYAPVQMVRKCFNTQPPEGGWCQEIWWHSALSGFNTQPPEGGWKRYRNMNGLLR